MEKNQLHSLHGYGDHDGSRIGGFEKDMQYDAAFYDQHDVQLEAPITNIPIRCLMHWE